ncbi:hypothetical protein DFP74_2100 [Nocardiopsis sp. Huas11]|uniref:hypothetical protein n=1 Tax=Nocardiopsis sp. Huas11 TaxID=2183912 RepID=UPI000F1FB380|nr:hypothetical protein [Nocardiopsis sp. Huas11]RKS06468.1 hypothetical protein DFP74_2100 [Nocardiopsis sp. Huas11]
MYDGPAQQFPPPPPPPGSAVPAVTRRGGTGRTVAITVAATLAAYAVVAGVVASATLTGGGADPAGAQTGPGVPTEPCAAPSRSQLGGVSARMPTARFSETSASCAWYAEFSDGSLGFLHLAYRLPSAGAADEAAAEATAEAEFELRRNELVDGSDDEYWTMEVLESREVGLGDEAVVSHFREGDDEVGSRAAVLVRAESVLVEVSASEPWEGRSGGTDFSGDEELLLSIAERAVTVLD